LFVSGAPCYTNTFKVMLRLDEVQPFGTSFMPDQHPGHNMSATLPPHTGNVVV
jgi:hypothetical protein